MADSLDQKQLKKQGQPPLIGQLVMVAALQAVLLRGIFLLGHSLVKAQLLSQLENFLSQDADSGYLLFGKLVSHDTAI
ncbi:MAG: hypothetical protein R2880_13760 [Deinococcales bacterium]